MQSDVIIPTAQIPFIQCYVCTSPAGWPPPIHRTHSPPQSAAPEASVHRDQTREGSSAEERKMKRKKTLYFCDPGTKHIHNTTPQLCQHSRFTAQDVLVAPLRC